MRALVKQEAGPGLVMTEVPEPEIGINDVLIRVDRTGICGTDLHIFDWNEWAQGRVTRVPMTFGHEVAGTVEAVLRAPDRAPPGAGPDLADPDSQHGAGTSAANLDRPGERVTGQGVIELERVDDAERVDPRADRGRQASRKTPDLHDVGAEHRPLVWEVKH